MFLEGLLPFSLNVYERLADYTLTADIDRGRGSQNGRDKLTSAICRSFAILYIRFCKRQKHVCRQRYKSKHKKVGVLPIRIVKSNVLSDGPDEGPTLETLDFTNRIRRIGSTPTFLYFDLYVTNYVCYYSSSTTDLILTFYRPLIEKL